MKKVYSFDDLLIEAGFSDLKSRSEVDLSVNLAGLRLSLPLMSAPMDTVTDHRMCNTLAKAGAIGTLHRFWSIEKNVEEFNLANKNAIVSVGLNDWDRVDALNEAGAQFYLLDVANGAQQQVVDWVNEFRAQYGSAPWIMVGNFATGQQIVEFKRRLGDSGVDAWRLGVGSGASCQTRVQTGCGQPTMSTVLQCKGIDNLVADGGIKAPGDAAKALAGGATACMLGKVLGSTSEAPGENYADGYKVFRGSASRESYLDQGKTQKYIAPEGASYKVKVTGSVFEVLQEYAGGIRSAFTYVGAKNLTEFQEKATLIEITSAGYIEGTVHGKGK